VPLRNYTLITASTNHRWLPAQELWWLVCWLLARETVSRAGNRHRRRGVSSAGSHMTASIDHRWCRHGSYGG